MNLAQINQRELDADDTSQTMVELQDKIQHLQEDVKLKDAELEALRSAAKEKVNTYRNVLFGFNKLKKYRGS